MKLKIILASLLTLLLLSSQASASVMVHGKDINTIGDILKEARGGELVKKGNEQQNFELPKDSIMRLYEGNLDLTHHLGNGNNETSLGLVDNYETVGPHEDGLFFPAESGVISAVAKRTFNDSKVLVLSSESSCALLEAGGGQLWPTNCFYGLHFVKTDGSSKST